MIERIPATLYLARVRHRHCPDIAIPFGTLAAVRRNSITDYSAQVTSLIGISIPEFWFAILSILVFSLYFGYCHRPAMSALERISGSVSGT